MCRAADHQDVLAELRWRAVGNIFQEIDHEVQARYQLFPATARFEDLAAVKATGCERDRTEALR